MSDEYSTLQHRWFGEIWNNGRADLIEELCTPDVVAHGLVDQHGQEVRGLEAFKVFYASFRGTFPDIHVLVEETVQEGDKVLARCSVTATHAGPGFGVPPSQKKVEFTGMCLIRVEDGKIAESWNNFDFLTLFLQIGVVSLASK